MRLSPYNIAKKNNLSVKNIVIFLVFLSLCPFLSAQNIKKNKFDKFLDNKITNITLLSAPLFAEGLCFKNDKIDFRNFQQIHHPNFHTQIDNYTQYFPLALTFGLKTAGVESHSSWKQFLFSTFMCYALDYSIVKTMKHNIYEKRPDISGNNSFPSGHTSFAFMNAHIFVKEYAQDNILYSSLAYSMATFTACMRVMNQRHWAGDVLAGAGIGLFSAESIYWLSDKLFNNRNNIPLQEYSFSQKHWFFNISTTYNFSFNKYEIKDKGPMKFLNGGAVGLEGEYFYNPYLGLGLNGDYACYRYYAPNAWEKYDIALYSLNLSHYFALSLNNRCSVGGRLGIGLNYLEHYKKFYHRVPFQTNFRYNLGLNASLRLTENTIFRLYADYTHTKIDVENENIPFKTINIGSCIVLTL